MAVAQIDTASVGDDTPLRLSVAAAIAFPDGSMTASGLRREIAKGRLSCERIANKQYTTLNFIKRMREQCRESQKVQGFISESPSVVDLVCGSSSTAQPSAALVAANRIAERLKKHSKRT